jgi:hypothetical protein
MNRLATSKITSRRIENADVEQRQKRRSEPEQQHPLWMPAPSQYWQSQLENKKYTRYKRNKIKDDNLPYLGCLSQS